MAKTLQLNLITPQKQLLNAVAVEFVALPALEGELGVLPGHIPMIVQLGYGSLRYKQDGKEEEFAVLGGFAEILHESVNVFAEGAGLADEIDEEEEDNGGLNEFGEVIVEEEKEKVVPAKYATTSGSIVYVEYENGTGFILNYNSFDITTEVNGKTYTVEGMNFVKTK